MTVDKIGAALVETETFLKRRGGEYERFLEDVLRELGRYRDHRKNSSAIYRVYSRADKQAHGERLKSKLGIATKLVKWRDTNPGCKIHEIHDIIGVTVVVFFEKEIASFCEALNLNRSDVFEIVSDQPIERSDYNARHLVLARRVGAAKQSVAHRTFCELQVKSLLHDGWATRTHDLIYKGTGNPDLRIGEQVNALTRLVKSLEEQSDILRSYIIKDDEDDEVRRDAASSQLFYQTTQKPTSEVEKEIASISASLMKDRNYFSKCDDGDTALASLLQRWNGVAENTGECRTVCRFMILLALIRGARDFDGEALESVEAWISNASTNVERTGALSFKGLALWALGDLEEAVAAARAALKSATDNDLQGVEKLRANLAYYVAERLFRSKRFDDASNTPEISAFLADSGDDLGERHRMSMMDTRGAILIMTATEASRIWEGQRLCQQARDWAQEHGEDKAVFELFYELHERRARRRLSQLT